jgi:hypothetical protein
MAWAKVTMAKRAPSMQAVSIPASAKPITGIGNSSRAPPSAGSAKAAITAASTVGVRGGEHLQRDGAADHRLGAGWRCKARRAARSPARFPCRAQRRRGRPRRSGTSPIARCSG